VPIPKITKAKKTESRAQAIEHLPSKSKAQSSNPSTIKKKKDKRSIVLSKNNNVL
jgi:hypothetical protein